MKTTTIKGRPPTILCVDDIEENLKAYRRVFRRCEPEAEVLVADTVERSLELSRNRAVDVALIDLNIEADQDGLDLLRQIKSSEETASIAVIMITAHETDGSIRADALELGADDFVSKPVDPVELVARLRVALRIKRSEEAIAAGRTNLRNLVEHNTDGMVVIDSDGEVLFANAAAAQILERDRQSIIGTPFELQVPERGSLEVDLRLQSGSFKSIELRAVETIWLEQPSLLVSLRDQTERHRLEEMLNQAQKMEAVGRLAGGVVHDFKNLLQGIQGLADLLRERLDDRSEESSILDQLDQITLKASDLTGQLLTFSHRDPLTIADLDINAVVTRTMNMVRCVLGQKVYLDVRPAPSPLRTRGDQSQLELILFNLCINARDAMPHGGTLTLATGSEEIGPDDPRRRSWASPGLYNTIRVTDSGCGMDRATLARIFEPFFTTKGAGEGTGLGLSTVYGIVDRHHGGIEVSSTPDQGSTFTVYLPASGETDGDSAPSEEPPRLLLIQRDHIVRLTTRRLLERSGFAVIEAGSEPEALKLLASRSCRLDGAIVEEGPSGSLISAVSQRILDEFPQIKLVVVRRDSTLAPPETQRIPHRVVLISRPIHGKEILEKLSSLLEAD